MPAPPRPDPPAHTIRIAISGTIAEGTWANVFWARNGNGSTPEIGDLADFAEYCWDKWVARFAPQVSGAVVVAQAAVNYYGPGGLQIGSDHDETHTCTLSGTSFPANCATCISWAVQQRYRGGHPRTYLPPATTSVQSTATLLGTTFVGNVKSAADDFLSDINAASFGDISDVHLGTVSFVLNKAWRSPPVFRDYTAGAAAVDRRIDSQRRRLGADL